MAKIENIDDLKKAKAHYKMVLLEQEIKLKEDFAYIKNYLDPKFLLRSIITPGNSETVSGHLLKNSAGLGAGILANRFLFSKSSWILKGIATLAVKSITTGLLDNDSVKDKVKSFLSRFRKNGKATRATTTT